MKKRIWLFHLLNDYSGSPLVLKNSILALRGSASLTVCTSPSEGFLSDLGINYRYVNYVWSPSKLITLLRFFLVQCRFFFLVLANRQQIDIVYVNTLLPFGAALAGKVCGKKVIYHMHEPQVSPAVLFKFLVKVADVTAYRLIFVSDYLRKCFPQLQNRGQVIYNVLNQQFLDAIASKENGEEKTVLMLCSFKAYKGIYDFVELARQNPDRRFELVLNSSLASIQVFKEANKRLHNLFVFSSTKDVHPFFKRAQVVLNLSHPNSWVESFGMTALEAMAYGVPCIVPKVGGISELVTEASGFRINHTEIMELSITIVRLFEDVNYYSNYSKEALIRSKEFLFDRYQKELLRLFEIA